ncbi:MAG: APC family permease [Oscillospiraceae bacterium]|jgi:APA family basic amino acid/polyamine antiporter
MDNKLQTKYGLLTAICMVVGIVIGSGIFFKSSKILAITGGSMALSVATVVIVGLIMIICANIFGILAQRYEKVNGIVDYAEAALGPKYGYYVAWFMTIMYYPILTSCLAWVSASYTCVLFNIEPTGDFHVAFGAFYLMAGFVLNALAPKLAGKFQVSTTIIKLIPLVLMAVVGIIVGLINGMTAESFSSASIVDPSKANGQGLFSSIVAFSFAYEGWIIATSINAELKNSKKNLPLALTLGSLICVIVYVCYIIGLSGALTIPDMINAGDHLPKLAFSEFFGNVAGTVVYVFIVISCLGTMNGLMMGCCRGAYSLAARGQGFKPKVFSHVDPEVNVPTDSAIFGLLMCAFWYFYWQVFFIQGHGPFFFNWEPDELPIITLYASYIPIFIALMKKEKDLSIFKRYILPALGIISCCFMVYCAFSAYGVQAWYYLAVFAVVMIIGSFFYKKPSELENK